MLFVSETAKKKIEEMEQEAISFARCVETVRQGTLLQSNARIEALEEKAARE